MASSVNFQPFLACGTNALATASVISRPGGVAVFQRAEQLRAVRKILLREEAADFEFGIHSGPSRRKNFRTILSPKIKVALPSSVFWREGSGTVVPFRISRNTGRRSGFHFALFVVEAFAVADQFEQCCANAGAAKASWTTPNCASSVSVSAATALSRSKPAVAPAAASLWRGSGGEGQRQREQFRIGVHVFDLEQRQRGGGFVRQRHV